MLVTVAEVLCAPALVGVSALAAARWGAAVAGVVSAFPAIVGPVLLILARERGAGYAADAAVGTLAGLVSLAAFIAVYGRMAARGWPVALASGWGAAALATAVVAPLRPGLGAALALAAGSLAAAHELLPGGAAEPAAAEPRVGHRMLLTALLVVVLAVLAAHTGALVGGMLTALPVVACILAVSTHRAHGAPHAVALLRGMATGMTGFVCFCAIVAALAASPFGFLLATATAVAVTAEAGRRGATSRRVPGIAGSAET